MNIVVIGAGGVGGYFGGKLTLTGVNTSFIVRGETFLNIKENGLRVKSILGDFHVFPPVSNDYEAVKAADLVLLGVKSWQIEDIARKLKPILPESAIVLPLQNGADNAQRLLTILESHQVIAGLCRIVSKVETPGVIDHFSYEPEIVFGEIDNRNSERLNVIKNIFDRAGFKNRISTDIQRDIWLKFLFIASISAMGALTRSVLGIMRKDPYIRSKLKETAAEIVAVAKAIHINITQTDIIKCFELIDKLDFNTTMSLQRDLMENRPSELDNFNGFIVRKGDELGIETPVNDFIYYSLLPMEKKVRS